MRYGRQESQSDVCVPNILSFGVLRHLRSLPRSCSCHKIPPSDEALSYGERGRQPTINPTSFLRRSVTGAALQVSSPHWPCGWRRDRIIEKADDGRRPKGIRETPVRTMRQRMT